jgi:deoxycytidylate deaminase
MAMARFIAGKRIKPSVPTARHDAPAERLEHESAEGKSNEIVIGLIGPVGADTLKVGDFIEERLKDFNYRYEFIRISQHVIPLLSRRQIPEKPMFARLSALMDEGNMIRERAADNAVLAKVAASRIALRRRKLRRKPDRVAYVVSSLKHPEEVAELRKIYGGSFHLIAIHSDGGRRLHHLSQFMTRANAAALIARDEHEDQEHGQHTRDTFHLADFFVADEGNDDKLRYSISRCLELIFAKPTLTPTFNEFAMFMAFAASLRSADLSRQVGAVIARNREILSTGANDCPAPGGGLYWPEFIGDRIDDLPRGRDYKRGCDSNALEKRRLVQNVVELVEKDEKGARKVIRQLFARLTKGGQMSSTTGQDSRLIREFGTLLFQMQSPLLQSILRKSNIKHITEYGRVVHAEMEALMACARMSASCAGATLYCTTFPCHNCAKHIIAAGIEQVIYVEPYPKSKAIEFHDEAVSTDRVEAGERKVRFKPFIGVAPRRFFDLFSMSLSSGRAIERKREDGTVLPWHEATAIPRVQMLLHGTDKFELSAGAYLNRLLKSWRGAVRGRASTKRR